MGQVCVHLAVLVPACSVRQWVVLFKGLQLAVLGAVPGEHLPAVFLIGVVCISCRYLSAYFCKEKDSKVKFGSYWENKV